MGIGFSVEIVSVIVGFLLSLLVERIPGVKDAWAGSKYKELIVAISGLIVVAALVGLWFAGAPITGLATPFIWSGLFQAISVWVMYITSSQSAYMLQKSNLGRKALE